MTVRPAAAFRRLAVITAVLTYLLIVMGGIVRVTGSGLGCGVKNDWPLCNGSLLPSLQPTAIIEFTHRWIAALATILVVALALAAWLTQRRHRRLVVASSVAAVLFVVQIALGALTVEFKLSSSLVMIHLANALLLLGVLVYIAVISLRTGATTRVDLPSKGLWRSAAAAGVATYVLALSGAFVVDNNAGAACSSWPLCGGGFALPNSDLATINVAHRIVAIIVVLLVGAVMGVILRRSRDDAPLRTGAVLVNVVMLLQIAAGSLMVLLQLPAGVRALHIALAGAMWGSVVMVAVLTRNPATRPQRSVEGARRADTLRAPAGVASA